MPDAVYLHGGVQLHCGGIVEADPVQPLGDTPSRDNAGGGLHRLGLPGETQFISVSADTPGAVAAHLAHAAVTVEKQHFIVSALGGGIHHHQAVRADGQMPLAQRPSGLRQTLRRQVLL